jgi:hypothetical protein
MDEAVGPLFLEARSTFLRKASIGISSPLISPTEDPTFPPENPLLVNIPEITNANNAKPMIRINTVVRFLIFSKIAIYRDCLKSVGEITIFP